MKLICQVEVINRRYCNIVNEKPRGKYLKSTLALGKEPKDELEYFLLHFSSVNRTGTKYSIKCLKQVFVKCLSEGKATLRFDEPPHDLCIKSEVLQLKCFMKLLKSCVTKDTKDLKLSDLCNISVTARDSAPTKLMIHNRSDFPTKGFPRTLEKLYMAGLKLCNFRRDILSLHHLAILDLSHNEIEKLPPEFGRMPSLQELYISNNQLGNKTDINWKWLLGPQITKTLKLLDLSGNKLKYLPKGIWKLQNLVTLKLDNNELCYLPATLGRINMLRYLTVSRNNLETLPCSLMQCHLEHIDLSSNKFQSEITSSQWSPLKPWEFYVNSLVHLASKVVLGQKMFYAPNIIPRTLVDFLDNANMCVCGKPVVNDEFYLVKKYELKDFFRVAIFDNTRCSAIGFKCFFCSSKCFGKC